VASSPPRGLNARGGANGGLTPATANGGPIGAPVRASYSSAPLPRRAFRPPWPAATSRPSGLIASEPKPPASARRVATGRQAPR
jgi:hypothetical protein